MKKISVKIKCLVMSACILLCGCDNIDTTSGGISGDADISVSGEPVTIDGGTSVTDGEPSEYPVIINGVTVNSSPQSVICLSSGLTEMIYELGFGDRLTGRGTYCSEPETVLSLKDFGRPTAPDIDAVISAKPEIVITATSIPDKDVVRLSDSGTDVLYIPAPRSAEEFGNIYRALGMVFEGMFDGEDDGGALFLQIDKKLRESDISLGSFIYVTEGLSVAGGDTFESSVLSYFGNNLAAGVSDYSFDKSLLTDMQPDTVVFSSDISAAQLEADPVLGTLDAVKNGKVITVNNSYFESPSGRITGIIEELDRSVE